jgi:hypothetical protein
MTAAAPKRLRIVYALCDGDLNGLSHRCPSDRDLLEYLLLLTDDVAHDLRVPDDVRAAALVSHKRIHRQLDKVAT